MSIMKARTAKIIGTVATLIAITSSMACFIIAWEEPKMPKSLYIKDK